MLKSLTIENFKILQHADLEFGKISVLIGPNRSGKSSVLHALALLKQCSIAGRLDSNGPVIDLGTLRDVVFHRTAKTRAGLAATWTIHRDVAQAIPQGGLLSYKLEFYANGDWHHDLAVHKDGHEIFHLANGTTFGETNRRCTLPLLHGEGELLIDAGEAPGNPVQVVSPNLPRHRFDQRSGFHLAQELQDFPKSAIRNFYLVPALRGLTETEYAGLSSDEEDLKHSWQLPDAMASFPHAAEGARAMAAEVLGAGARVRRARQGVWVVESISGSQPFNIVNEGTGLNQLTHLLFVLAAASPDSLVGIEEPELHLHPAGQARLAELFVRLVKEQGGPQLVMTTHSEHLALELLIAVAEKRLRPEDLSLYYFERREESGAATRLHLNEFGQVQGGLPGFFEPEADQLGKYLLALSKK